MFMCTPDTDGQDSCDDLCTFVNPRVPLTFYMIFFPFCSLELQFHDIVTVIFMSHTTVAALVALFLDCTLAKENDETTNDTGLKWWEKFSLYSSDVRNDEFYALPCKLNKLFPAL